MISSKIPDTLICHTTMVRNLYNAFHVWSCDVLMSERSFGDLAMWFHERTWAGWHAFNYAKQLDAFMWLIFLYLVYLHSMPCWFSEIYWVKCRQPMSHTSLTTYVHISFCLKKVIRSWLYISIGKHGLVICMPLTIPLIHITVYVIYRAIPLMYITVYVIYRAIPLMYITVYVIYRAIPLMYITVYPTALNTSAVYQCYILQHWLI